MSAVVLQLGQASQAFTTPTGTDAHRDRLVRSLRADLSHGDDVVGFTEVAKFHSELREACHRQGFTMHTPVHGDVAVAVRRGHAVERTTWLESAPGVKGPAAQGGHGPRGVFAVTFRPEDTDELVTFCEGHWVTRVADQGGQQVAMTEDMAAVVRRSAQGRRLGFWAGDTNHDDRRQAYGPQDAALRRGELTSCWDELGKWPSTHRGGATLDVVGSFDPDRRVKCLRAHLWAPAVSDHRALSAWYVIHPARA